MIRKFGKYEISVYAEKPDYYFIDNDGAGGGFDKKSVDAELEKALDGVFKKYL